MPKAHPRRVDPVPEDSRKHTGATAAHGHLDLIAAVTVTLYKLEHRGLISNTRKRITLTDMARLRALTQAH